MMSKVFTTKMHAYFTNVKRVKYDIKNPSPLPSSINSAGATGFVDFTLGSWILI